MFATRNRFSSGSPGGRRQNDPATHITSHDLPDTPAPSWRRGDPVALAAALALIAVAAYAGRRLLARGVEIVLPSPPLIAYWDPHVGWGTPLAVRCVLVGLRLQRVAATLPWRRLLLDRLAAEPGLDVLADPRRRAATGAG